MIEAKQPLSDLQERVRLLDHDQPVRCEAQAGADAPVRRDCDEARETGRTGLRHNARRDEMPTRVAGFGCLDI
jgi:hypothetical protein